MGEDFGRSGQNVKVHVRRNYDETGNDNRQAQPTPAFLGTDEISLAKGSYRLVVYDLTVPWRPQFDSHAYVSKEGRSRFLAAAIFFARTHHWHRHRYVGTLQIGDRIHPTSRVRCD